MPFPNARPGVLPKEAGDYMKTMIKRNLEARRFRTKQMRDDGTKKQF
jgi:hypothetical protein